MISDGIWDGAALLSFYFLLAVFPGMLMLFAAASMLPIDNFSAGFSTWSLSYIPGGLRNVFSQVIDGFQFSHSAGLLSLSFLIGGWTAVSGVSAVIRQLNVVYHIREKRSYFRVKIISITIALGLGVILFLAFALLLMGKFLTGALFDLFLVPEYYSVFVIGLRFLVVGGLAVAVFAMIYSLGPDRSQRFTFFSPGSMFGAVTFLLTTQIFAYYLNNYANYGMIYGPIGAFVGLMMWFYILGFLLIFGAELNYISQSRQ